LNIKQNKNIMKKLLYLFLVLPLIFSSCKKEDDAVSSAAFTKVYGCTDENAVNFNSSANVYVPNICCYSTGCELGCTDEAALNYNFQATVDDGGCDYATAASWDCNNGSCSDPGTGNGQYNSLSACQTACGVTASWDCDVNLGCYDPGTGNGQYNSLSACNADCGSPTSGYEIFVTVTAGTFASEVSWEIYDPSGSGTTIAAGGAPYSQVICIPSANLGSLEFRMYDSYDDGWNGSTYTLSGNVTLSGTTSGTLVNGGYGVETFNVTGGNSCNK
jgi:hypothetical protein